MNLTGKTIVGDRMKHNCPSLHIAASGNSGLVLPTAGAYLNRCRELRQGDLDALRSLTAESISDAAWNTSH